MTVSVLTVVVVDDERPARRFLVNLLKSCTGVECIGEAASGNEALALIHTQKPQLALLDLQMPEMSGLEVVRRLAPETTPLVAFVTAFDDHAIEAFELNAIDYLLKPVQQDRLQATLDRARQRLQRQEPIEGQSVALAKASVAYERASRHKYADRLPLRQREKVVLVPVRTIASIVAEGELLHIRTANETFTITHRLHALEARLDPRRFIRLSRGTLVNVDMIVEISPMPGGTYMARLTTGEELNVSRIQSRALRESLLRL